jgi:hypothetical protein
MMNIQIVTLSTCTVLGCTLEIDATRSGSNTQNATSGAMKSAQVQTTGKSFFAFSGTLNALPVYLNYTAGQNIFVPILQ